MGHFSPILYEVQIIVNRTVKAFQQFERPKARGKAISDRSFSLFMLGELSVDSGEGSEEASPIPSSQVGGSNRNFGVGYWDISSR